MAKKTANTPEIQPEESSPKGPGFFEYLRFGESYTSLILGIIVVIISTALLLSFVHSRNATNVPNNEQTKNIVQENNPELKVTSVPAISVAVSPTITKVPTAKPTVVQKVIAKATKASTVTPTKAPSPTEKPKVAEKPVAKSGEYIVKAGDTLWSIAESQYKSGYNWVDIARANNLSNPGIINSGNKLILPKVTAKTPTVVESKGQVATSDENNSTTDSLNKISGNSYKIVHGDTLWSIAVRAYGDGYKWVDIAKANNLSNPGLIHGGNTLKIPRNNNP